MGKTGFEKFTQKMDAEPVVKLGARATERIRADREVVLEEPKAPAVEEPAPAPAPVPAPVAPAEPVVAEAPRKPGRPKIDPATKKENHRTTLDIDEDVYQKLESMKYVLHKSTVKAVIMTAVDDLFEKYGVK